MFDSRQSVGELLTQRLKQKGYGREKTIVFAIPRGGVVTGKAVADALGAPLDIVVVRKIPAPHQPELAIGAVGPGGTRVIDISLAERTGADENYLKKKIQELKKEVGNREAKFRAGRKPQDIKGKTVIVVDDGVATGATVEAAIRYLKTQKPKKIILAVPVASQESIKNLKPLVGDLVVLDIPEEFMAVGQFYREFPQVSDDEVVKILNIKD